MYVRDGDTILPCGRDPILWGPQDPLDLIGPTGPFDDEEAGEESWRVSGDGRFIWTGETHAHSRKSHKAQQERQTKFWEFYDAQKAQGTTIVLVDRPVQEDIGESRFPDALPEYPQSEEVLPMFVTIPTRLPESALTQAAAVGNNTPYDLHNSKKPRHVQGFATPQSFVPPGNSRPFVSSYTPRPIISLAAPRPFISPSTPPPTESPDTPPPFTSSVPNKVSAIHNDPIPTPPRSTFPSSSPPETSSARSVNDWTDDSLLRLWISKVVRKEGNEPVLKLFPGHTVDTLQEIWKARRPRCEELGAMWDKAGRPKGPIAGWWRE
ncbi:hypothetical protein G6514_002424 [Epicoccum nigrum]|nr:hypothetical protein G6514_002424 [Epicoccum nigrum]